MIGRFPIGRPDTKELLDGSLLSQVQDTARNEVAYAGDYEERQACDERNLLRLRYENVQDWKERLVQRHTN